MKIILLIPIFVLLGMSPAFAACDVCGDFNGDGYDDLAVGVAGESVGAVSGAGAVNVIYGSSAGLHRNLAVTNQFWTQDSTGIADTAESGDSFGDSLTSGDFNGDGYDDLAVGVAGESVGAVAGAGAVNVIYGSSAGLHRNLSVTNQFWTQDSVGIADVAEEFDLLGSSLSSGDFNNDGYDDLAIGVSSEDIGAIYSAGAVNIIYGSSAGLHRNLAHANQFWTQDSIGIADIAETYDLFGSSLLSGDFNMDGYDDLAIGADSEDIGAVSNTGAISIIYGSSAGLHRNLAHANQLWTQDSTGIADVAETADNFGSFLAIGDFNNDGYDDLAVGVSYETLGLIVNAGAVNIIYGSSAGLHRNLSVANQFWSQDSVGIADAAESNDNFGSLSSGDFNNDGYDDLAIGVSSEDIGAIYSAGAVNIIYGSSAGLHRNLAHANQFWTQDSIGIADIAEDHDYFGSSLLSGDFNMDGYDDLAVGADSEDIGAVSNTGAISIIYGSSAGLHRNLAVANQFWTQDSVGIVDIAENSDYFDRSSNEKIWVPKPGTTWNWELDTPVVTSYNVDMFDIDLFDNTSDVVKDIHSRGAKAICYISVGSRENWRPDATDFPLSVIGNNYYGWTGEKWLDIRQIDQIGPIMEKRFNLCKQMGFDGIEPDNIDEYTINSGFPITYQDQLTYNIWLANKAHERGLSIGLKNDDEQVNDLITYFDWALLEDCYVDAFCNVFDPFITNDKAVFQAEYTDSLITTTDFCGDSLASNFSGILKDRELTAWYDACS